MAKKDIDQDEPKEPENIQFDNEYFEMAPTDNEETLRINNQNLINQNDVVRVPTESDAPENLQRRTASERKEQRQQEV